MFRDGLDLFGKSRAFNRKSPAELMFRDRAKQAARKHHPQVLLYLERNFTAKECSLPDEALREVCRDFIKENAPQIREAIRTVNAGEWSFDPAATAKTYEPTEKDLEMIAILQAVYQSKIEGDTLSPDAVTAAWDGLQDQKAGI